jgi:hypothetical protein
MAIAVNRAKRDWPYKPILINRYTVPSSAPVSAGGLMSVNHSAAIELTPDAVSKEAATFLARFKLVDMIFKSLWG